MAKVLKFSSHIDAAITSSYDGLAVHEKMIKDKIRTGSYRDAMELNTELLRGKTVLDVGCGTGILSMFAARAGAKHVYAVDISDMIYNAEKIAEANGMGDKITFIKGRVEDAEIPPVDIIVSEWMGFCLFSEMNLDCVLFARDNFLKPGGLLLPNKTSLHLAAIECEDKWNEKVNYWDDVFGLDFSTVKPFVFLTGYLGMPEQDTVITNNICVLDLDISTILPKDDSFLNLPVRLEAKRAGTVHAFLAWFDYDFTYGVQEIHVSTGPYAPATHWKRTVFYVEKPISLKEGDILSGVVSFEQIERDLNVRLRWELNGSEGARGSGLYKVDCIEV